MFSSPRTLIRQASIVTPGMVYGYGVIVYKSQEIKDAATRVAEQKLYGQIERQQDAIRNWQFLSPALLMQETLSALSGTHWHQFNQFSRDVDLFRTKTQRFFYPRMATEKTYRTFSATDADAEKVRFRNYHDYSWLNVEQSLVLLVVVILFIVGIGYWRLTNNSR